MTTKVDSRLNSYAPAVLSLYRIVFGFLFSAFGSSKLFDWPIAFHVPTGTWPAFYAGVIEFVCGLMIVFGLLTRPAAFIASGEMAVAYFWQHQPHALWPIAPPEMGGNGGLEAILFCFGFFLLVFTGPGAYALDSLLRRHPQS
ncbi:MAG: DoxX family protein [Mycobacterium sp.]